jgi:hypothetical protein
MPNYKTYQFNEFSSIPRLVGTVRDKDSENTTDISGSLLTANVDSWSCSGGLINEKH